MEAFRTYDKDNSGTIDKGELKALLRVMMGAKVSDSAPHFSFRGLCSMNGKC